MGSINKIDATHPHNWNTVSNLCVCGIATHEITRFGAIPISSYICAGVSKVGGKLTLPCTRKVLNKIGSTGSKSHRQLLLMLVVLLLSVRVSTKSTDHIKQYFIKVGMWLYCGYSLSFTLWFFMTRYSTRFLASGSDQRFHHPMVSVVSQVDCHISTTQIWMFDTPSCSCPHSTKAWTCQDRRGCGLDCVGLTRREGCSMFNLMLDDLSV